MTGNPSVIVVGGGNAGLCAAVAASDAGADVTLLERAPIEERGGNTHFTAGAMRVAYDGVDDLRTLMPDLSEAEVDRTDFGSYPASQFFDDLARVTDYRTDPDLAATLVDRSLSTLQWMREHGVRFAPIYGRQAFLVDGRFTFWGGLTVEVVGGGPGLVEYMIHAAEKAEVRTIYGAQARELVLDETGGVRGVIAVVGGRRETFEADAVVLASGGFQSNVEWRTRYLGRDWDLAKVRGTRYNTGDGHAMAIAAGASPSGNWSGAHAVGWEYNAPEYGDMTIGDAFQKHSYPYGVMVNTLGKRFLDEGADFRNYTYAKYGREILAQPHQMAWQIFDRKAQPLLRDEYRIKQVTKVTAGSLEELAAKISPMDSVALLAELSAYNDAVDDSIPFNPNVKDGRHTVGLAVPKSNWANRVDEPPFEAYAVTCGITFTFGGIRIDTTAQVLDAGLQPVAGLFAAGEIVGGIFYHNYPGGSGLTNGAVYGCLAGQSAAAAAMARAGADSLSA